MNLLSATLVALAFLAFALVMARCADAARFFGDHSYELYAAVLGAVAIALVGMALWSMAPT